MKKIVKIFAVILALACTMTFMIACTSENNNGGGASNGNIDFYITYKGTKIELDKDATPVISALGEANDEAWLGDCGGFGLQTRYTYDNFVIYTVKNDSGETIDQISLSNDLIETSKGICIGDSSEKVIEAYGEPMVKNDKKIEYESGSFVLKFGLENGAVKSINFIRITASAN